METVLITGASSGIGYELAKVYAKKNYNLVIVARRKEKLESLKQEIQNKINSKINIEVIKMDLEKIGCEKKVSKYLKDKNIEIDILINNAGFGIYGLFEDYSDDDIIRNNRMIDLNIKSLVNFTREFLLEMKKKNKGLIINVASTAAFMPAGPLLSTYYASKSFVLSFSDAIKEELRKTDIKIKVLCPGPTKTEFEKSSNLENKGIFDKMKVMSAEKVANICYSESKKNKFLIIPGMFNKIFVLFSKFLPRKFIIKIIRVLQEKK